MMDAVAAPKMPSKDAVVSQGAGRADKSSEGGFAAVLSNSGEKQEDAKAKGATAPEDTPAGEDTASAEGQQIERAAKKPIIDISMAGQAKVDSVNKNTQQSKTKDEAAKSQVPLIVAEVVDQEVAGEKTYEVPDPHRIAQLLKNAEVTTDDVNGKDRVDQETGDAQVPMVAADEAVTDLGDVLQLLAGGQKNTKAADTNGTETAGTIKDDLTKVIEARSNGQSPLTESNDGDGGNEDMPSQQDRTFRFARADGKGQPMALQAGNERARAEIVETPKTPGIETISVVESRRYIAPVSTNAMSISSAMLGDGDWVRAMSPGSELANAAAQSTAGKVVHTLKLQMSPIELGNVTATLKLQGEQLTVQLTVESHAAQAQLKSDQDEMLKALKAQGFAVDQIQVNVQIASTERGADSGQNGTGQQNGQLAQQSNQGADGQGRQAGQSGSGDNGMRGGDAGLGPAESGHDRGNDGDRSGGIYI